MEKHVNKNIMNIISIVVGCTVAGGGVFLARSGLDLITSGVLPYLRKVAK